MTGIGSYLGGIVKEEMILIDDNLLNMCSRSIYCLGSS